MRKIYTILHSFCILIIEIEQEIGENDMILDSSQANPIEIKHETNKSAQFGEKLMNNMIGMELVEEDIVNEMDTDIGAIDTING